MSHLQKTKRFTYLALFSAMAITLNMLETAILTPFLGILRVGLANIIALMTIEILGVKEMIIVNLMRVLIGSLLSGMFLGTSFWISAGGVLLSSLTLYLCNKAKSSLLFTSVMSSIAHSAGQVIIVIFLYKQLMVASILPYFLLFSIPAGFLTGSIAKLALKRVKPLKESRPED